MTITFSLEGLDLATQQEIKEKAAVHLAKAIAAQQALDKVYTVKTLAQHLDCHEDTVRGLLERQEITYSLLGKKGYRVTGAAVQAYLDKRC